MAEHPVPVTRSPAPVRLLPPTQVAGYCDLATGACVLPGSSTSEPVEEPADVTESPGLPPAGRRRFDL